MSFPINPANPNEAILQLAQAVDQLSGPIAALTAYIAATSPLLPEEKVLAVKGAAQKASPPPLTLQSSGTIPALVAGQTVDQIRALTKALLST